MNILDSIRSMFQARQEKAVGDYKDLVLAVANEEQLKPADAERILRQSDKTPDDLADDVEFILTRRHLSQQVQDGQQALADLRQVVAQIKSAEQVADKEITEVRSRHIAILDGLRGQEEAHRKLISDGGKAEQKLRETADPSITAREAKMNEQRTALQKEEREIRLSIETAESNARAVRAEFEERDRQQTFQTEAFRNNALQRVKGFEETLASRRARLDANLEAQQRLKEATEQLHADMLVVI